MEPVIACDDYALCAYKKKIVTKYKIQSVLRAVDVNLSVKETLCFRVTQNIVPFETGCIYRIINVDDDIVYTSKYNRGLNRLLSSVYSCRNAKAFMQANKTGLVKTVSIDPVDEQVPYDSLEGITGEANSVIVPEVLRDLPLSADRMIAVGVAFGQCLNIGLLLDTTYEDSCITQLMRLMGSGEDVQQFSGKGIPCTVLTKLVDQFLSGKDVSRFLDAKSVNELDVMLSDTYDYLSGRESKMREAGTTHDAMVALNRLAYQTRIDDYLDCKNGMAVYLRKRVYDGGYEPIARYVEKNGVLCDEMLQCDWQRVAPELRPFVRKYFSADNLTFKGKPWTDVMDSFFANSTKFVFERRFGYGLQYRGYTLFRDRSSIFLVINKNTPVWRSMLIDGRWISTQEREDEIML